MRVTLYVDNGTDADVVARVEGGDALAVPAHEFRAATLPAGARQVTVREVGSGRPVEDLRFVGERDGLFDGHRYVLNVAGANRYGVYQTHYGDTLGVGLGAPD
ncbi:MAG TPA: hypothetical protein VFF06_02305, partial [Polyangia bacterium]|nr:hypothetical protein [Polyangia bacterium]